MINVCLFSLLRLLDAKTLLLFLLMLQRKLYGYKPGFRDLQSGFLRSDSSCSQPLADTWQKRFLVKSDE